MTNPLTPPRLALILSEFKSRFGQDPLSVHIGGSHADGSATAASDIDVLIETTQPIPRFSQPWFDFLKAINPGVVPAGIIGVGRGAGFALVGNDPGDIPKAGLLDPFFKQPGTFAPPTLKVH
ncbi:MAG: nucleotidyltransferase domain-containing protein [Gemmataceae bacterium]|nr:nucleotidyltransferase domain-containing protein [Gemmataceae bacterium]